MSVNRFTGPVGPCVATITIPLVANAVSSTATKGQHKLPAGMGFVVTSAYVRVVSLTSDPSLTVGTTTMANSVVAAVNVTSALASLTIANGGVFAAGAIITAEITNDTGDAHGAGSLQLDGYYTGYPTAIITAVGRP